VTSVPQKTRVKKTVAWEKKRRGEGRPLAIELAHRNHFQCARLLSNILCLHVDLKVEFVALKEKVEFVALKEKVEFVRSGEFS
jgi:hypothetical protein